MKLPAIVARLYRYLHNVYSVDFRSLALFRILVAIVVIADLLVRLPHSTELYSDWGVFPRANAISSLGQERWSLLLANGSVEFAWLFIVAGLIAATMLLFGWHTRTVTVVLWIALLSIQTRNNHVAYGGDTLIRLSLFWGMFLPLGAVWSLDSRQYRKPRSYTFSSFAALGLIVLNASVYLFTALLKDGSTWRSDFNAVYYAVGMRDLSTPLGEWLFQNAPMQFFRILTMGTLWIEFAVPIMLLIPIRSGMLRIVAVVLVVSLHLGIGSALFVGLFPAISIASIVAFLPPGFWEFVTNLSRTRFPRLASIASDTSINRPLPVSGADHDLADDESYLAGDNRIRRTVDFSRYPRILVQAVCIAAISLGLMWNVAAVTSYQPPDPLRRVTVATGLYQDWAMFAPDPRGTTIWFVIEGELANGTKVDLLQPVMSGDFSTQYPPVWDQSNNVLLNHEHWRKYLTAIRFREDDGLKFAGYTCRSWNAENADGDRLESVTFTVASATTLPNSERAEPAYQTVGFWNCS